MRALSGGRNILKTPSPADEYIGSPLEKARLEKGYREEAEARRERENDAKEWFLNHLPKLPPLRHSLPKARPTLCEAISWLALQRIWNNLDFLTFEQHYRQHKRSHLRIGRRIEDASGMVVDACAEGTIRAFSQGEQIPASWFTSRGPLLTPQIDFFNNEFFKLNDSSNLCKIRLIEKPTNAG